MESLPALVANVLSLSSANVGQSQTRGLRQQIHQGSQQNQNLASNKVVTNHGLVCHLFLRNLKPGVARFIRNKDCANIKDTYFKACNTNQKMKST